MNRTRTAKPRPSCLPLLVALGAGFASAAQAQSLVELYNAAKDFDATYQSAKAQALATVAKGDQSKAGILPTVNLGAGASQTNQDSSLSTLSGRSFNTQSATLSASQPLYRPGNWATYAQGKKSSEIAQAQLVAADQDLIVRISQAYFDVLAATDTLTFLRSQKDAVAEQLASAKRNFEVGTSTIVDTRDAQARFDLTVAQELAADNDLRVKSLTLDQLVGKSGTAPKPLRAPVVLGEVQPADVNQWVQQSEANNPAIQQAGIALEVAKLETEKAQDGHKPTLDLTGSYSAANNNGSSTTNGSYTTNVASVGLSFNLPLFAGYAIQNRVKETLALEDKARSDLDAAKRTVAQATRTAFFGVQSGLSQVKAYEAAEVSSQSALDANKLGYQVGVKINIDVLNSQSQLYSTKATLAKARYDVLMGGLKLRQASGLLKDEDLQPINAQLAQ
ncbi:channel protein TolC [Rhodoferax lacus]|uniref:Channel protein TolC n=1 Tax=Rhodoferax lacus TaxID=2184758 RepID=A0A3E1RFL9_9BURK|nr:TolC family outer membrane protein [Rhodoferax lacus]RFO98168.1 channel protein TolC [Rhodoferax lacus]